MMPITSSRCDCCRRRTLDMWSSKGRCMKFRTIHQSMVDLTTRMVSIIYPHRHLRTVKGCHQASSSILFGQLVVSGQQLKLISTETWSSVTTSGMIIPHALHQPCRDIWEILWSNSMKLCCAQMTYDDMAFRCQTEALNSWIEQQEALPDGRICVGETLQIDPVSWHLLVKLFVADYGITDITDGLKFDQFDLASHVPAGKPPPRGQAALAELWPPHGEWPSWRHVTWRRWLHNGAINSYKTL